MGLGEIFTRDIKITQTDTQSGASVTDVIVTAPGGAYPEWGGQGPYGGGMQIAAAWRASLLLSDLLGRVPLDVYRSPPRLATHEEPPPPPPGWPPDETPPDQPPPPPILEQPSPPDARMVTFSSRGLDALFHGNA